jgi:hypothetical protein
LTVNFQQDEQELALDGRQIILALVSAIATVTIVGVDGLTYPLRKG